MLDYFIYGAREALTVSKMKRIPEPMVMEGSRQVQEYFDQGVLDSSMMASNLFHAAGATLSLQNSQNIIDLGCGPGTVLALIAERNPDKNFVGIDLSSEMLTKAERLCQDRQLKNVRFLMDDISQLSSLRDSSFDGAMSTMALHHLPTEAHLEGAFKNLHRILGPKRSLYLFDFCLLKSKATIEFLVNLDDGLPPLVKEDYWNSLAAAFGRNTFEGLGQAYFPEGILHRTPLISFMQLYRTTPSTSELEPGSLTPYFNQLSPANRKLLKDLTLFFKWGGFNNPIVTKILKKW